MKKVYVAGAYSANNIVDCLRNIGRGEYYSAKIFMMGFAPFCPWHDKDYVIKNWDKEFTVKMFYDYSMVWLDVSDIIFLVPGWEDSKGTLAEIERAKELGIPIVKSFEELESVVDRSEDDETDEMILRKLLWMNHRCDINALYGDDGELSCGNCLIDFKRMSAKAIENKFIQNAIEKLYAQQKEKTCLCGYVIGGKDKAICPVHKDEKES